MVLPIPLEPLFPIFMRMSFNDLVLCPLRRRYGSRIRSSQKLLTLLSRPKIFSTNSDASHNWAPGACLARLIRRSLRCSGAARSDTPHCRHYARRASASLLDKGIDIGYWRKLECLTVSIGAIRDPPQDLLEVPVEVVIEVDEF